MSDRLQELLDARTKLDNQIEEEKHRLMNEAAVRVKERYSKDHPKWAAASEEQRQAWYFLGYDPDNPDIPTD